MGKLQGSSGEEHSRQGVQRGRGTVVGPAQTIAGAARSFCGQRGISEWNRWLGSRIGVMEDFTVSMRKAEDHANSCLPTATCRCCCFFLQGFSPSRPPLLPLRSFCGYPPFSVFPFLLPYWFPCLSSWEIPDNLLLFRI